MVLSFPKRRGPRADASRTPRAIEPPRRALTARDIAHRERMLSHIARLNAARRA
jgi:hypothetical protein